MNKMCVFACWMLLFFAGSVTLLGQGVTLVDFGASTGTTTFGLVGWNTVLKSGDQSFTALGNGGLITTSDPGEYGDYRGLRGTTRQFVKGERIVVTWYNNSDESFFFTARISFNDADEPNESAPDGQWYTMRSFADYRLTFAEILPHATAKTVFNITDSGVHKTDASYALVNINLAIEWGSTYQKPFLVCDKIELLNDADITAPAPPNGLAATVLSHAKIKLNWETAPDNAGTVEYLVLMNGDIEGYSRETTYTCVYLEPEKQYTFSVLALDAAGNTSAPSAPVTAATGRFRGPADVIHPAGFEYTGAISLPDDFNWGGDAITFYSQGEGGNGSLFVTNLNQPENGLVGEVSLPAPVISPQKRIEDLPEAATLRAPVNIRPANINAWDFVDIWRTGLEYVLHEERLYSSWSYHYTVTGEKHASISACDAANFSAAKYGAWFLGDPTSRPLDAGTGSWLFSAPRAWADANCSGRSLIAGRCRDGGLSGLGPTLYAFAPVGNTPPAANSVLPATTLLEYGPVEGSDNYHFPNSIDGYKHSDDWREAEWLGVAGQEAVAIVGNKALGDNWYGYHGERMRHDWVYCDVPYPEFYETDPDGKGWRAHNLQPMIILYDPADLAQVAKGQIATYAPQPYAAVRLPKDIFFSPAHEIFSAAFSVNQNMLYVTEFLREPEGRLLLHAWRIKHVTTHVQDKAQAPKTFSLRQNYPNPFNSQTTITFNLPAEAPVRLVIRDVLGREIKTMLNCQVESGEHKLTWDGKNEAGASVSSGIYFCCLKAGASAAAIKLIVVR